MGELQDAMAVFRWAKQHGDPKIYDRIIVKVLPQLQNHGIKLSAADIDTSSQLMLPAELVGHIRTAAEQLIESDHPEIGCNV